MYNLKGAGGFDRKFPFDSIIILEELFSNLIVIVDVLLIVFQKGIICQSFPIAGEFAAIIMDNSYWSWVPS